MSVLSLDILGELKRLRVIADAERSGCLVPDYVAGADAQLKALGVWLYENGFVPDCKEPHCADGACHERGECPPPEPY